MAIQSKLNQNNTATGGPTPEDSLALPQSQTQIETFYVQKLHSLKSWLPKSVKKFPSAFQEKKRDPSTVFWL